MKHKHFINSTKVLIFVDCFSLLEHLALSFRGLEGEKWCEQEDLKAFTLICYGYCTFKSHFFLAFISIL